MSLLQTALRAPDCPAWLLLPEEKEAAATESLDALPVSWGSERPPPSLPRNEDFGGTALSLRRLSFVWVGVQLGAEAS